MNLTDIPVIRTKIIIPRRRSEILTRTRLLSILDNVIDLKLLILAAPAGYGKTSLMIDFANHTQLPVCWFSLDTLDVDAQRFIAHFLSSIANQYPAFGAASFAALQNVNQDKLDLDAVVNAIINDCYENITENFVFVLDDYHLVRDSKPIESFINRITQEMPENFHMIIASRTLLTLPDLSLLVARSQVGGLSFEELAFIPEEIKQLMVTNYHQVITDDNAKLMADQTEGWITGLLLTAQLSSEGTDERLRLERVSGVGLYEYLAQQVFDRQDESMKLFLMRTSLLEEFNAEMCEKVIGASLKIMNFDWAQQIGIVQRDNLFVLPLEDSTIHLRYHHLFRDFLQSHMRTEKPEETQLIEKALAAHYIENRDWERAMAIYSRIGNVDQVSELIRDASPGLILGGRLVTLTEWIDTLPESEKNSRPEILSVLGTVAMMRGSIPQSLEILDRAISGLRKTPLDQDLIASLIRRSIVNRYLGKYTSAMADIDEALEICAAHPREERLKAEALRVKGVNLFQKGELRNSLVDLQESLRLYQGMRENLDAAKVLLDLGVVLCAMGNLQESETCYTNSLDFWQKTQNSLWQSNVLNNLGGLQLMRGHFEMAAHNLERAVNYARLASNPRLECYSLTSLGDLFRDIRAFHEAHKAYSLAQGLLPALNDLTLQVYLNLSQCALERLESNYHNAHHYLAEAEKLALGGGSKYDEALCQLEAGALAIQEGKFRQCGEKLKNAYQFFNSEGFEVEEFRAEYFLQMANLRQSTSVNPLQQFLAWVNLPRPELQQSNLTMFSIENHGLFQQLVQANPENEILKAFVDRVSQFDYSLIETRKLVRRHSKVVQFTTPRLAISALGKTQVKIGEHPVTLSAWRTQGVRDLFFFIFQHDEGVTREEICDAFWPEADLQSVRLRFKNAIYRVRHALGPESITLMDEQYRFNRTLDYDFDVENFLQEIASAQAARENSTRIQHYRNAVALYRGPYLPKMDYDWVLIQRESLNQKFNEAASNLVNLLIESEQYQQVITYTQRVIEIDPCSESAHRSAMTAFAALGDRAGVVRQYEKCKKLLLDDLGVKPSSQTETLYKTLMQ
jgi:ATP/maltotriose-dependent transcriptional regulator MalT/DNA-binding SARP family transcriptional activator